MLPLLHGTAPRCAEDPGLGVVRAVCVNTIAVILKRGWLDMAQPQRDQFFQVRALQQTCRKMGCNGRTGSAAGLAMATCVRVAPSSRC